MSILQFRRPPAPTHDYTVQNEGTLFLIQPHNVVAENHLVDSVTEEALWHGDALIVEHRYAHDFVQGLLNAGFTVK